MRRKSKSIKRESKKDWYQKGYEEGLDVALTVISKLLADNGIRMAEKEFWKEYELLKKEGVI